MESLATVVAILFLIAIFAGPVSIGLSSRFVQSRLDSKASLGIMILNMVRKALHLILVTLGTLIGAQFLLIAGLPLLPRIIGLASIITCYIALRREYFPESYFVREVMRRLGVSRKNGSSSGSDGHGPAGQH